MVSVVVKAWPQDVHLGLADGGGTLVVHVVRVGHDLANVLLEFVARWQGLRDVVGHLGRRGEAGDAEVGFHPDGDCEQDMVVLVICTGLGVAGPGRHQKLELGDGFIYLLGLWLQDGSGSHLNNRIHNSYILF